MIRLPIAILVKRFPKVSETFILHEILALEAMGWPVTVFTLLAPSDEIVHLGVAKVRANVVQLDPQCPAVHFTSAAQALEIRHIHAHFANEPAALAALVARQMGIGYSISAHAKDIYLTPPETLRANMADARFVVTCTGHNATHLRDAAPGVPVAKLYHGIDCERLCPGHGIPATPPLILSVGRLRAKKGFDTLIDACARLAAEGLDFRCEIVGYGPEEHALCAQIERLALSGEVRLSGKMAHDDVLDRMRAASLFALPCRIESNGDRDGIPNVILEAMAMGVPIISTPVSGVPEVVQDGASGKLVQPDDPGELATAISFLFANPQVAATLATNARATVTSRFGEGRDMMMLDRLLLNATGQGQGSVGYVIKGFPRLSESFISNEVLKLERLGKNITIFAASHGDALSDPVLAELTSPLAYLPEAGSVSKNSLSGWLLILVPAYLPAHWRLFKRRPSAWLSGLRQTIAFARRYRYSKARVTKRAFFKQFAQAGAIAEAAQRAGVTHLHGHFCHSATTITWLAADMAGCSFSFTAHAKDIYQAKHNPGDLLARKVAAAAFVTTCTEANHKHLIDRVDTPAKLHTVYHGLDTGFFRPPLRKERPRINILAVGRHVDKKGFDLLVYALAMLRNDGIAFDCRIIGEDGPATAMLAQAVCDHALEGKCRLDPPESRVALKASYEAADIFVLPCRIDDSGDRDGIPNVLAEAMAMGLAVVSTTVSGIPEIVQNGVNGILVPPDSAEELATAIASLANDALLRTKLGEAATRRIADVFDADRTILDMKRLFDGVLSS
jgi:glycosyltransferase involved in cell wall biosynthesis